LPLSPKRLEPQIAGGRELARFQTLHTASPVLALVSEPIAIVLEKGFPEFPAPKHRTFAAIPHSATHLAVQR